MSAGAEPALRIVSGGQSGVDRAALDVALARALPCGGWCPRGRRAEDGPLDPRYPLRETPQADSRQRTSWNVRDADATLILARGALRGGTLLTARLAEASGKPLYRVDFAASPEPDAARAWLRTHAVRTLNVAGPRESEAPGIQAEATRFLERLLTAQLSDAPASR